MGGYPTEIFKKGFDCKVLCNACNRVLRDPVQSYCGHRFCRECISAIISSGNQVQCKSCIEEGVDNEDYSIIRKEQLFPDNALRREMFSMESNCYNLGCPWTGKFRDYEKHVKDCKFRPIPCPNCGESVEVSKVKSHAEKDCPKRPVTCKYCSTSTSQDQLEEHNKECQKYPMNCESCGIKKIQRDKFQEHVDSECPNKKLECIAGCKAVERRRFISHIEEKPGFHIKKMMDQLRELALSISGEKLRHLGEDVEQLKQTMSLSNDMQQNGASSTSRLSSTDEAQSAEGAGINIDANKFSAVEIKVGTFEGIVTTLYRDIERVLNVLDDRQKDMEMIKRDSEGKAKKIEELERKLAYSEVQVTQLSQNVFSKDNCSFNGELVWRIENWSEVRAKAVAGTVTSLFSLPFYTSKYGYKMCVRLYPNGDGMGKNTHISIFFAILKGDYDAILTWPFSKRVIFTVFDQSGGAPVRDSFRTDPNSSSFKRPTSDMNIASGCPLFLPLSRLQGNDGFVKDNVMFIKTQVEEIP